ncbi:hypothetical protein PsorP6_015468 [Peronosclerospora sorghi]|uniref:Uncharacterized protein n=1 Tax=Peronosclerospora sorghi TaxID=230839 RepID=A0ACC0WQH5_9STRA|nr:hypothetical protein PsorP6_015468 [Peronosclerospora sorghi]
MHTHVDSNEIFINKSENSATKDLVFQAKMERVLEFLDVMKLARLAAVYACSEMLNTVMLIPMLVMCIYRSRLKEPVARFAQDWVNGSTDKLGALAWSPRVAIVILLFMKMFGQVQFMIFLQQDVRLICVMFMVTAMLVVNFLRTIAGEHAKLWGEGRRLKLAAYVTALIYWVVCRGEWTDTLRLLGPVFIDSGGVLGSVTSFELQEVCRRVFNRLFNEGGNDIQTDGDLDVCFVLGKVYQTRNDFTETVTYLMNSLFVHYAHVRSKIKSMTLFADIDAATQKIHRICCGSTVDAAAVVSLILSNTVQQRYLICCRYRDLFKQILTECVKNTSEYGVILQILSSPLVKVEAEMLREATTEVERIRDSTFSVVMSRSNAEVALQKNTYEETYGEEWHSIEEKVLVCAGEFIGNLQVCVILGEINALAWDK